MTYSRLRTANFSFKRSTDAWEGIRNVKVVPPSQKIDLVGAQLGLWTGGFGGAVAGGLLADKVLPKANSSKERKNRQRNLEGAMYATAGLGMLGGVAVGMGKGGRNAIRYLYR
jgi:hypothetical protein